MAAKKKTTKDAAVEMPARVQHFNEELSSFLEGWQCVDSDVRVDGELVAELMGRIGERLVFVHHLSGPKAEVIDEALKHISCAASDARRLARQYEAAVEVQPLVVIIVEGKAKGLLQRLEVLCPDSLRLFVERRLSTAGRRARFLEELTPAVAPPTTKSVGEEESIPARGAEPLERPPAALAWDEVIARLDRLDPGLERVEEEGEMRWSQGGEVLCCVAFDLEGHLVGRIGTDGVQQSLSSDRALEVFLDWVLAHHIELTDGEEQEGLRHVELLPHPSEPLLTPEELAAFLE